MIKEFHKLKDDEIELIIKAPLLTCILIAGADGNIDKKEIKEAITFLQQSSSTSSLAEYFKDVVEDFEDKFKILLRSYPHESAQRNPLIEQDLSQLNNLWPKLPKDFSKTLYLMLKKLAERIASSSGGLWGVNTVAAEEAKYLTLSMIADPSK